MKIDDKTVYICYYTTGYYDDYREINVFVTGSKSRAIKWIRKFNRILDKWKQYYSRFETKDFGSFKWIGNEYVEKHFNRWNSLKMTNGAYITEIEIR